MCMCVALKSHISHLPEKHLRICNLLSTLLFAQKTLEQINISNLLGVLKIQISCEFDIKNNLDIFDEEKSCELNFFSNS